MQQPPVRAMIDFCETWWGDHLDDQLIARIARAPVSHIDAFRRDWPHHWAFRDGPSVRNPELEAFALPPLEPGEIRPPMQWSNGTLATLSLLLYSDGLVISSAFAAPFSMPGRSWDERSGKENRRITAAGFHALMQLRPLIESDVLLFSNVDAALNDPRYLSGDDTELLRRALLRRRPDLDPDEVDTIAGASPAHRQSLRLAGSNLLTLVATSEFEQQLFTRTSPDVWRMLVDPDLPLPLSAKLPREHATTVLARTVLPDVVGSIDQIARLRSDDEMFARWRRRLHDSLMLVGEVSDDPAISTRSRGVLLRELELSTKDLVAGLDRSRLAAYLGGGLRTFAVGLSRSLLTSFAEPAGTALLDATVDGAFDAVQGGVEEHRRRRSAGPVHAIVLDFRRVLTK